MLMIFSIWKMAVEGSYVELDWTTLPQDDMPTKREAQHKNSLNQTWARGFSQGLLVVIWQRCMRCLKRWVPRQ